MPEKYNSPHYDDLTVEDGKGQQRRKIKDTLGFHSHGLISAEDSVYEPPSDYPKRAKAYLKGLSRCGTLAGACKLAGISTRKVYVWRKNLEGFMDEEEIAKDCLTDVEEESLFNLGLNAKNEHAQVKALEKILKANRPKKYNRAQKSEIKADVEVSWLDILKQSEEK